MRGFDDLARAGKIVFAGLSNFAAWRGATVATIADLRDRVPLAAIEAEYSLLQRTTGRDLLPRADAWEWASSAIRLWRRVYLPRWAAV